MPFRFLKQYKSQSHRWHVTKIVLSPSTIFFKCMLCVRRVAKNHDSTQLVLTAVVILRDSHLRNATGMTITSLRGQTIVEH